MGLNRLQAGMSFSLGHYWDVIDKVKKESLTDFNTIVLASQSHLAVGNFVNTYYILSVLFETDEPIYQLPDTDKRKSYPLGYDIFRILKNLQVDMYAKALRDNQLFPITNVTSYERKRFAETYLTEIISLSSKVDTISIEECIAALIQSEMAMELSDEIGKIHYEIKALYLDRLVSYFSNQPVDDIMNLLFKGSIECLRMANTYV